MGKNDCFLEDVKNLSQQKSSMGHYFFPSFTKYFWINNVSIHIVSFYSHQLKFSFSKMGMTFNRHDFFIENVIYMKPYIFFKTIFDVIAEKLEDNFC